MDAGVGELLPSPAGRHPRPPVAVGVGSPSAVAPLAASSGSGGGDLLAHRFPAAIWGSGKVPSSGRPIAPEASSPIAVSILLLSSFVSGGF